MGPTQTTESAVSAAVGLAEELGLAAGEPRVLRELTNVLVHLAPEPVIVRAPMTFTRLRGADWVARELRLVRFLADADAAVAAPVRALPPGPYERDGFLLSLWELADHDPERPLDAARAGERLREIHGVLAGADATGLPHFARLDEIAALVGGLELSAAERDDFARALDRSAEVVSGLDVPLQPVHGDAHPENVLRTPNGPVWTDFENLCLGPRELDLACLTIRGHGDAILAGYGEHDAALVELLRPVHALFLAAWTFVLAERVATIRPHAEQRLGWALAGL